MLLRQTRKLPLQPCILRMHQSLLIATHGIKSFALPPGIQLTGMQPQIRSRFRHPVLVDPIQRLALKLFAMTLLDRLTLLNLLALHVTPQLTN